MSSQSRRAGSRAGDWPKLAAALPIASLTIGFGVVGGAADVAAAGSSLAAIIATVIGYLVYADKFEDRSRTVEGVAGLRMIKTVAGLLLIGLVASIALGVFAMSRGSAIWIDAVLFGSPIVGGLELGVVYRKLVRATGKRPLLPVFRLTDDEHG